MSYITFVYTIDNTAFCGKITNYIPTEDLIRELLLKYINRYRTKNHPNLTEMESTQICVRIIDIDCKHKFDFYMDCLENCVYFAGEKIECV
jgi:hypothetical protein